MKIIDFQEKDHKVWFTCTPQDSKEWKKILFQAKTELGKNLKIKGFRVGKIPETVLDSKLNSNQVLQQGGEIAKKLAHKAVIEKHKAKLYGKYRPFQSEIVKISFEELTIIQTWQKLPSLTLKKNQDFSYEMTKIAVESEEIVMKLKSFAEYFATFEKKTTPAQWGDYLLLDCEGKSEEKVVAELTKKNHNYPLGSHFWGKEFDNHLLQLAKGAKKNFTITLPANYHNATLAKKKVVFKVEVLEVQVKKLPPVDEQLVAKLGNPEISTVAQLEKLIKKNLIREKISKFHPEILKAVWNELTKSENVTLEISPDFLKGEVENMKNYYLEDLKQKNQTLEQYLAKKQQTKASWEEEVAHQTRKTLINHLVVDHLAAKNKITVKDRELEDYYQFLAERNKEDLKTVKAKFSQLVLHNNLLRFKVENFLVQNTLQFNQLVPADFFEKSSSDKKNQQAKKPAS